MGPGTYEGKEKMVYLPWMSLGTFSELSKNSLDRRGSDFYIIGKKGMVDVR